MTPKTNNLKLDVLTEYIQRRDNFYQRLGGAWSRTLNQPTDILEPISVTVDDIAEINAAARGVMAVYSELAILVRQLPRSALERIGIPETLSSLVDTPSLIDDLLFARLDFIVNGDGIKMVDCNLDAPGLIVETFEINKLVCSEMRAANPNQMARQLLSKTLSGAVSSVSRFVGRPVGECNTAVIYGEGFIGTPTQQILCGKYLWNQTSTPRQHPYKTLNSMMTVFMMNGLRGYIFALGCIRWRSC